jgi:hypothetical protein
MHMTNRYPSLRQAVVALPRRQPLDDQAGFMNRTMSAAVGLRPACFFENTTLPSTITSN